MSLHLCVIGSGSGGNCTALWTAEECLLIDCGKLSLAYVNRALAELGIEHGHIKGIVITHAHGDHIDQTTLSLSWKYSVPIYVSAATFKVVEEKFPRAAQNRENGLVRFHTERFFSVGSFEVRPFKVFHGDPARHHSSAGHAYGFCIHHGGEERQHKVSYVTDTRKITPEIIDYIGGSHAVVLESNHDLQMVREKAPADLQWMEHLSNIVAGNTLAALCRRSDNRMQYAFLAHISRRHNRPGLPLSTVSAILKEHNVAVPLVETSQTCRTEAYRLG